MELAASRILNADRATVWAALNSAEVLKACIPGCEELTGNPEEGFAATVKQKVGPVSATLRARSRCPISFRLKATRSQAKAKAVSRALPKGARKWPYPMPRAVARN